MAISQVQVTDSFRKSTVRAIFSIALFLVTYILLILFAVGITGLFGYLGIMLILFKPMFLTLMVGLGLISMGVLVLVFLLKFMFSRNKQDLSHLVEIKQTEQPELFGFLQAIVDEVKTDFPKKVFMSTDVNAAVFYDSSFWSMFLPIKKNLQIGAGLVNAVSVSEFQAILAHEFGHFSQKSMKVGSYVYNVNKVIYNMLYDNDDFGTILLCLFVVLSGS
jgi:Zn-dependent protease with chaperone function